jgi:hypothetical protein
MPQPTKSLSQMPAFHHYNTTCNITPKREKQITKTQTQNKQASNFLPSTKRKK